MPLTPESVGPSGGQADAVVSERRPVSADVDLFGLTDRGQVRKENQDQFLIATLHKLLRVHLSSLPADDITPLISESRGWLFLVADGVGGRPDGQAASGTAVRTIAHYVTHLTDLYRRLDPDKESVFLAELEQSVQKTHEVLRAESEREYGGRGGATTLTMVAALWPRAYLVQVGDSRCYRLRDGRLELMSTDQTVAQALVDSGALTQTEARRSPFQGVLASALGGREARPMTHTTEIRWDDIMLLCTDGLTKHVTDPEIEAELGRIRSAEESCRRLVSLALERGGTDNVTVVIARLKNRPGGG
ncbi:MAG: PP2C family protein-serine/threonine phosphatase [Gemmatimonadales bacterium]